MNIGDKSTLKRITVLNGATATKLAPWSTTAPCEQPFSELEIVDNELTTISDLADYFVASSNLDYQNLWITHS